MKMRIHNFIIEKVDNEIHNFIVERKLALLFHGKCPMNSDENNKDHVQEIFIYLVLC